MDAMKTEGGVKFPRQAYAYVPNPDEPSTWKLRLWESPSLKVTAKQVGMAVAALGAGFRGNKVEIPASDRAKVVAKVRAAWHSVHEGGEQLPPVLKMHAEAPGDYKVKKEGDKWCLYDGTEKIKDYDSEEAANTAMKKAKAADAAEDAKDKGADEDKEMMLEFSNAIRGVEIFATGTHNGDTYTEKDLDDMVESFNSLDVRPAVKVGHTKDKVGAPAYGWIGNLRRAGNKLLADFTDMHDSVVQAIRERKYDRVSSEIYFNLKRGGQTFRRALKAVALLGAEVPAVAGLKPLHKMEFSAEGFETEAAFEHELEVNAEAMVTTLAERVEGLVNYIKEMDMSKNAEQIKKLSASVDKFEKDLEALLKSGKKEDDPEVKRLSDMGAELKATLAALQKADASDAENEALKARLATLEQENRTRTLKEKLDAIKVPAFRSVLKGLYAYAIEHPEIKVKVYAQKDGKETQTDGDLLAVADAAAAEINAQSAKLFQALAQTGSDQRKDGSEEFENPALETDRRVKELRAKDKDLDYEGAMIKVFEADPDLRKRYEGERTVSH